MTFLITTPVTLRLRNSQQKEHSGQMRLCCSQKPRAAPPNVLAGEVRRPWPTGRCLPLVPWLLLEVSSFLQVLGFLHQCLRASLPWPLPYTCTISSPLASCFTIPPITSTPRTAGKGNEIVCSWLCWALKVSSVPRTTSCQGPVPG